MPNISFDAELNELQYEPIDMFQVAKYNGYLIKIPMDICLGYVSKVGNGPFFGSILELYEDPIYTIL